MKKTFLFPVIAFLLAAPVAAQTITVNSPDGTPWCIKNSYTITWTSAGVTGDVDIILRPANAPTAPPTLGIAAGTTNDGSEPWPVPKTIAPGLYLVRIRSKVNPSVFGDSANFEIKNCVLTLTVISPNGGEEWATKLGGSKNITWTAAGFTGNVDLVLKRDGKTVGTIVSKLPAGQGTHSWKVGELLEGKTSGLGGGFKVRVVKNYEGLFRPAGTPELADESDAPFTIVNVLKKDSHIKNIAPGGMTQPVMKPNLVLCSIGPPKLYEKHMDPDNPGFAKFNFVVAICNPGTADSAPCWIEVVFSGGGGGLRKIDPVKVGEFRTEIFSIRSRLDDAQSVSYTVWVDKQNLVDELDEWDNTLTGTINTTTEEYGHCSDGKLHYPTERP